MQAARHKRLQLSGGKPSSGLITRLAYSDHARNKLVLLAANSKSEAGTFQGAGTNPNSHASRSHTSRAQRIQRRKARDLSGKSAVVGNGLNNRGPSVNTAVLKANSLGTSSMQPHVYVSNSSASSPLVTTATTLTTVTITSAGTSNAISAVQAGTATAVAPVPRRQTRAAQQGHRALVLDCAYRPINVVTWDRAVMWDVIGKASVLEYYPLPACAISGRGQHLLPAVLRVNASINLVELAKRVTCTRRNVLIRDKFTCQYCGAHRHLTLDHVHPASRGGKDTWTNLVTACTACNQAKGNRTLDELKGWKLRTTPREPRPWEIGLALGFAGGDIDHAPEQWEPFLADYKAQLRIMKAKLRMAAGMDEYDSEEEEEDGEEQELQQES